MKSKRDVDTKDMLFYIDPSLKGSQLPVLALPGHW